jgi:glutamate racemase
MPKAEVFEKACPMFVPLVENGYIGLECRPCVDIAEEYLEPLKQAGVDTLILGCTHYPMLSDVIAKIMGDGVTLISSGGEAGKTAYNMLRENGLANDSGVKGKTTLYCTDSVELFRENAEHFLYDLENENIEIKSAELY